MTYLRTLIPLALIAIIMLVVFNMTKSANPHVSELAFTERSSFAEGSVIPASCESGIDHGVTQTCWDNSIISVCGSCPVQPATCTTQTDTYVVDEGCSLHTSTHTTRNCGGVWTDVGAGLGWADLGWAHDYADTSAICNPTCANGGLPESTCNPTCANGGITGASCYTYSTTYCTGPNDPNGYNYQVWQCADQNPAHCVSTGASCLPQTCENGGLSGQVCCLAPNVWASNTCQAPTCENGGLSGQVCCLAPNVWASNTCQAPTCQNGGLPPSACCPVGATWVTSSCVYPNFTISAYIRGVVGDSATYTATEPITAQTADGSFYDWSYRTTQSPGPVSCTMQQRNDSGAWYPSVGYATDKVSYTFNYSSLSNTAKQAFVSDFQTSHSWKINCIDANGASSTRTWSITRPAAPVQPPIVVINPPVVGSSCTGATITVTCTNANAYKVLRSSGAVLSQGPYSSPVSITSPGEDTYMATCSQGATESQPTYRTCSSTTFASSGSLTASPRSLSRGGATALSWLIQNPTNSCTLTAAPIYPTTCTTPGCRAPRDAEAAALNTIFSTGTTDTNDQYNQGTPRSILSALRIAVSGTTARGKKTVNLNYSTLFTASCGGSSEPQSVRVLVTDELER